MGREMGIGTGREMGREIPFIKLGTGRGRGSNRTGVFLMNAALHYHSVHAEGTFQKCEVISEGKNYTFTHTRSHIVGVKLTRVGKWELLSFNQSDLVPLLRAMSGQLLQ